MENEKNSFEVSGGQLDLIDEIGVDEQVETTVKTISKTENPSPLRQNFRHFVSDRDRVLFRVSYASLQQRIKAGREPLSFELAGPRENIYFDPSRVRAAVVTCGGLCPGINNVIRAVVMALYYGYGVRSIIGIRYGLQGFIRKYGHQVMEMGPEIVERIHESGGTILASSRGPQPIDEIVDRLVGLNVSMLFLIGGDGTFRAGKKIAAEIEKRGLKISIISIPKTIDNDIYLVSKTFGFDTAVEMACQSIRCAHTEAIGCPNGIGLVKVMGRHSGFIAAAATNALREVNYCLIPESDFDLEGKKRPSENSGGTAESSWSCRYCRC